jgi:lysyl-tRNA synthetase class 2
MSRDEMAPGEDKTLYNEVFKKLLHLGDFIGVKGFMFRTRTGEITVHVKELTLLGKSLRPLPVVKTDEARQRARCLHRSRAALPHALCGPDREPRREGDLPEAHAHLQRHAAFVPGGRLHEVDTPVLQPIPGGAAARPFVTHHNALDVPFYLRIANELYLKRLIVGGFEGVFEFSRNFRNEGMDRTHNPEFTIMELYVAYKDYRWMMDFMEAHSAGCAIAANGAPTAQFQGKDHRLRPRSKRITMCGAIQEKTGVDVLEMDRPSAGCARSTASRSPRPWARAS